MDLVLFYLKILKDKKVGFKWFKKDIIKIHNFLELDKKDIKMEIFT
jgi:hypothetical protein